MISIKSEKGLAALAGALAGPNRMLTRAEQGIPLGDPSPSPDTLREVRHAIARGDDPLGEAFCRLRAPAQRRECGAIYTPQNIIDPMVKWAKRQISPSRIVDPGAGSGRFLLSAAKAFPNAELVAIETDPLATLVLRANAAALDQSQRLSVLVEDYRAVNLPETCGATLFIGNPPYVRHHGISPEWKTWFAESALSFGLKASKLAGLHIHFFLKTRLLARPGDSGAFVTSAEWLDVNYGKVMRKMLVDCLGGTAVHVIAPAAMPFAGSATTGAITCFRTGRRCAELRFRAVDDVSKLGSLCGGRLVDRTRLDSARRWSPFLRPSVPVPRGRIELGELCRVHRGQVTGCNAAWIDGSYPGVLPDAFLVPTVTRARELFDAGLDPLRTGRLKRVIDLPIDLGELNAEEGGQVHDFLIWAKSRGADASYVARNRRAWWAVGLREPAPILATYMARRPPTFVRNQCEARHLNIAHGIYPRETLSPRVLDVLAALLRREVTTSAGRTYAGGLTKFEPRELERVLIPPPGELNERAKELDAG